MTRINCIPVEKLTSQHLLAEYREMLRMRHVWPRKSKPNIPTYRMGKGHVLFFADKGQWLVKRHRELRAEMRRRGMQPNITLDLATWPEESMNDWTPPPSAKLENVGRLIVRLS